METNFCLLGHPADYQHLGSLLARSRPDFTAEKLERNRRSLTALFELSPSYVTDCDLRLPAPGGSIVHGKLIICTFLPQGIDSPRRAAAACAKIKQGCRLARECGASIVGLGGFTSILAGEQGRILADELGITVTSGNSLTAALALQQLDTLLARLNWKLENLTVALLGASGDIGTACARSLAQRCERLMLVARGEQRLSNLREQLGPRPRVEVHTDINRALDANVIVATTSASRPVLFDAQLRVGTVVCDLGFPKNLSHGLRPRPDILVFSGGIAHMAAPVDLTAYTQLPAKNLVYGCFAEAMVLAASRRYESFSVGQGCISVEKMRTIIELARSCGFTPAPLYSGYRPIGATDVEVFLDRCGRTTCQ